jgi:hypothetical protein
MGLMSPKIVVLGILGGYPATEVDLLMILIHTIGAPQTRE